MMVPLRYRPGFRRAVGAGIVILVLAIVAGGFWWATRPTGTPSSGSIPGTGPQAVTQSALIPPDSADQLQAVVLVDGWTEHYLPPLSYNDGVSTHAVTLSPANAADVAALADTRPDLLTSLAARLVTADPKLTCGSTECADSTRHIPLSSIVSPNTDAVFGTMYQGYGIKHGLYYAVINLPSGTPHVAVKAAGWSQVTLLTTPISDLSHPADRFLLGGGFGKLFPITPSWVGQTNAQASFSPSLIRFAPGTAGLISQLKTAPPLTAGLAVPYPALALTDQQMTAITSPSTGCLGTAVCVPGTAKVTVTLRTSRQVKVTGPPQAIKENQQTADAVIVDADWHIQFSSPTFQYGALIPGQTFTVPTGGAFYTGKPPLVSGTKTLRVSEIIAVSDQSVVEISTYIVDQAAPVGNEYTRPFNDAQANQLLPGTTITDPTSPPPVAPPITTPPPIGGLTGSGPTLNTGGLGILGFGGGHNQGGSNGGATGGQP